MEIQNTYLSASQIYAQLALKKSELASIDKKDEEKSSFEKKDKVELHQNYDENDYQRVLSRFKNKDNEVRTHEQLHASKATTTTPINYSYQAGPDGKLYAVGGYVRFDTSIPKDEAQAMQKLNELQRASTAPKDLSSADSSIAQRSNLNKLLLQSLGQGMQDENR